jgi:capsular polysaccharide biosynthesis protein
MNNKKYMQNIIVYFKKYRWVFIGALVVAVVAGFFNWRAAQNYNVSLTLAVNRSGAQSAIDYQYDDYYALKATDEFGDTVVGWFKTPELPKNVYQRAKIETIGLSLNNLARRFKASKISPNLVEIRFSASTEQEARGLAEAISEVVTEKSRLDTASTQKIYFLILAGEPVIVKNSFDFWSSMIAGLIIGLVAGFFISAAKEYFK